MSSLQLMHREYSGFREIHGWHGNYGHYPIRPRTSEGIRKPGMRSVGLKHGHRETHDETSIDARTPRGPAFDLRSRNQCAPAPSSALARGPRSRGGAGATSMRSIIAVLAFPVLQMSCDSAFQSGRFVMGKSAHYPLEKNASLHVISGNPAEQGTIKGGEENLFYVLCAYPTFKNGLSSGGKGHSARAHISSFWQTWLPRDEPGYELKYDWDRDTHTLIVGDQNFKVEAGNLFVIHLEDHGPAKVTQIKRVLSGLPVDLDKNRRKLDEILAAFKLWLPGDPKIQSVDFPKDRE